MESKLVHRQWLNRGGMQGDEATPYFFTYFGAFPYFIHLVTGSNQLIK